MNGYFQQLNTFSRQVIDGSRELKKIQLSTLGKVFSLMGKKEKIAFLVALLVVLLSGIWSLNNFYKKHTVAVPDHGGTFTEVLKGQPQFLNPVLAFSEPDLSLTRLLFSALYKYDGEGKLVPDLAENLPEINEDQKQYTIILKKGAKWHDGRNINADDVVFTFKTIQNPAIKSPYASQWQTTAVEKLSEYSVKFVTKDISAPFLSSLTLPLLPEFVWMKVEPGNFALSEFNLQAVGSGPYSLSRVVKTPNGKVQSVHLESFKDYHNKKPYIKNLIIKFADSEEESLNILYGNEADAFGFTSSVAAGNPQKNQLKFYALQTELPQYQTIFFNLENKILAEKAVRVALSLATDRKKIAAETFGGQKEPYDIFAFNFGEQKPDGITYSPAQAEAMLDKAGWTKDDKDGKRVKKKIPLSLTILTSDFPTNNKAGQILTQQWQQLGIDVKLEIVPGKKLSEEVLKSHKYDVLLFSQKFSGDPDPFAFWHSSQAKFPGLNLTSFSNPEADRLITEARSTLEAKTRLEKYQSLNSLLASEIPTFSLTQNNFSFLVNKEVKKIELKHILEPSGRYNNISDWYIKEKRVWK